MEMDYEQLMKDLLELNQEERKGKRWYLSHGEAMSYTQLLPAPKHYSSNLLRDADFFHTGKTLEIEKALCYVDIPAHRHEFLELAYLAKGPCRHQIEEQFFDHATGDFIVIPPGTAHTLIVPEGALCLTIKIRRDTFVSLSVPNTAMFVLPLLFPCGDDAFVRHAVLSLYEQQTEALPYCDEIMTNLFVVLMIYLMQRYHDEMRPLNMGMVKNYKTLKMVNYIYENYQVITLRGLAEEFHYNESYLSDLIRKGTGKTFTENLREIRLFHAEEILRTTPNIKLAAVCEKIGYGDTVQFVRDFKARYGITPAKYKMSFR